ncbi:kinesin-like protein KIF26B [Puma concolor]|uniref:Kinesin-like protein KIF26B n=1 Tax=Puma concolor TaxID=9696 RepID=A0A6P6I1Y6_PUMCO|nr:kinesin-like protein KIF26B [Puma concolor]
MDAEERRGRFIWSLGRCQDVLRSHSSYRVHGGLPFSFDAAEKPQPSGLRSAIPLVGIRTLPLVLDPRQVSVFHVGEPSAVSPSNNLILRRPRALKDHVRNGHVEKNLECSLAILDAAFSAVIHDKLQVPNTIRKAWNDKDNRCDICATHLNQLKQEAIQMVVTLEQAAGSEHYDGSPGSPPALSNMPTLVGSRHMGGLQQPRDWAFVPASYASPNYTAFVTNKHSSKPNSLGVSNGAEKKSGSPTHQAKVSLQMATSPSNGNILNSVAIQAHQYLDGTWSLSRTNGVTLYPYQISQLMTETGREGLTEAALNRYNADKPSACGVPASQGSCVASETSTGTSVAASFFARAAQKLNLSSKKKKHRPSTSSVAEPPLFATSFSGILQTCPPPAPPCLLRAVNKVKDTPGLGKVKVMLRICSTLARDTSESSSFLKVDPRKKQITLYDPLTCGSQNVFQKRGNQVPPKMFAFDAVFPQDASQAEVCAATVAEVIQSVVNGADGCVFCFGHAKLGKSYTMIGKDDSMQNLGIIPCAISWLFKLINERKEKTGARFSVRISAVEVWGKEENLKDLLSEVATGSLQDGQSPGVYLCEDPICGTQLQNQSELRAPTAEKAAFFLDAAIASRRGSQQDCDEEGHRNSHMLFTLHIYQYRMEKSGKGGMSGGRSRLHLIDLGSCVKALSKNREGGSGLCLSLSALGNVILALVNGSKHIPYKESKLTMLLRESLGNVNCRTTMIAHISAAAGNYAETLSTIQIASRVLRMKKKKTKYTSSSSGGESSCEEGRMRRPTQLRPFHARAAGDPDFPIPPLSSDPDYSSSSEQSCDTVIYIGPNGTALSDKELTDNEGPPDFVPIVPALQKARGDGRPPEAGGAAAGKSERDCLKCNTFAELQERLDCIDGSEEPSQFPFEELPVQFGAQQAGKGPLLSQAAGANPLCESEKEEAGSDGQLTDREGTDPPASKMQRNHSPGPTPALPGSPSPASPRSIPGSGGGQHAASQLTQSPSLQSSRESLNSCGFVEGKPRPMGSPRLGIASLSKTSEYKPASSPSQRCKVYTQKGVLPSPAPLPPLSKDACTASSESLLQPEVRTPPVGMSPQVLKKSMSAGSQGFPESPVDDEHQGATSPDPKKEVLSTTTVTVQQPLELNGEDELVFTLVEELTISGVLDGGRPTSIISFNSDCSVQALASGSRPVSIIGSISEDLECYSSVAPVSEVSITQFLPLPKLTLDEKAREAGSQRSSISSWLSEVSAGSDGEQSCHSFIAQTCFGHGEAMADPPASELGGGIQSSPVVCREKPEAGPDGLLILSDVGEDSFDKATPIQGCKISTLGKAMVTISNTADLSSCEGYIPMKTNITVYPCIAVSPRPVQGPEASIAPGVSSAPRAAQPQDSRETGAKIEMRFEDPWLKREEEVKKESAYPGEEGAGREAATGPPAKPEARAEQDRKASPGDRLSSSSGEVSASPGSDNLRRVADGCEMALPGVAAQSPVHPNRGLKSSSLPRAFQKASRQEEPGSPFYHCAAETNGLGSAQGASPCKAALERKAASPKHCMLARPKGTPPLPPVRKSSLDQKNRASPQHSACSSGTSSPSHPPAPLLAPFPDEAGGQAKEASSSSRLFSAKLEQLASRTNSLGRATVSHYECLSLERAESLCSGSWRAHAGKDSTMPRAGRSPGRGGAGASPTALGPLLAPPPPLPARWRFGVTRPAWHNARSRRGGWRKRYKAVTDRSLPGPALHSSLWSDARAMLPTAAAVLATRSSVGGRCRSLKAPKKRSNSGLQGATAALGVAVGTHCQTLARRGHPARGHLLARPSGVPETQACLLWERRCRRSGLSEGSGSQRRRLIPALSLDTPSPVRKPASSTGVRWVDGPLRSTQRGLGEPFEIKVYEIDDVERLQRRRGGNGKEVTCFNAKLKILEHRQQRIAEVRAKYEWLMKELEVTKQHLMLDPNKWLREFDLEQVWELDSLEYLEALECVTERLESRVNFCKAHLMMVTCFDITSRRR